MTNYEDMRRELVEDDKLKIAINLGNAALAHTDEKTGELSGVTVALAKRLCAALRCEPDLVEFTGAGKVVDAADRDAWRIAFCAIDPEREEHVSFSTPYVLIEAKALVRTASSLRNVDELDRDGITLMVAYNSAYDLYLSENARHMTLLREPDPGSSFEAFKADETAADAIAGVTQSLEKAFGEDAGYRMLDGTITAIGQAMVLPKRFEHLQTELTRFIEEAKVDGYVRQELDRDGQHALKVAPPA